MSSERDFGKKKKNRSTTYMLRFSVPASFSVLSIVFSKGADVDAGKRSWFFLQKVGDLTTIHEFPGEDSKAIHFSDNVPSILRYKFFGVRELGANALSPLKPTWSGENNSRSFMLSSTSIPEGCSTCNKKEERKTHDILLGHKSSQILGGKKLECESMQLE